MLLAGSISSIGDELLKIAALAVSLKKLSYNSTALTYKELHDENLLLALI